MLKSLKRCYLKRRIRQRHKKIRDLNNYVDGISEYSVRTRVQSRIDDLAIDNLFDNEALNAMGG